MDMIDVKLEKGEGRGEGRRGKVELEEVKRGEGMKVTEEVGANVERAMKGAVERERCRWRLMRKKRVSGQVSGGGMVS